MDMKTAPRNRKYANDKYSAKIAVDPEPANFLQASGRSGGLSGAAGRGFRQTEQPAEEANQRPPGTIQPVRFRHDRRRYTVGQVRAEDQKKDERQVPEHVHPS